MANYNEIEKALDNRAKKKNLNVSFSKMRYANSLFYGAAGRRKLEKVLFVGIGHGHNAVLALLDGLIGSAVGVDPYIASHGNDEKDMESLMELIDTCLLSERLILVKSTIEDYMNVTSEAFDAIICEDVLHHIFECSTVLRKSKMFLSAINLFQNFWNKTNNDGLLLISEVNRYGLRPFLQNVKILNGSINYKTKQPWQEWTKAAVRANWRMYKLTNYVPYVFREKAKILSGPMGRYSICHRYHLSFLK